MKKIILLLLISMGIQLLIPKKEVIEEEEWKGVFISYIEISKYLNGKEERKSKETIQQMIQNVKEYGLNTIILQVRPSCDAIYFSKIFPISKYLNEEGNYPYDVLDYFLQESHKADIKVIAWINPYRISTTETKEDLKETSPAYPYKDTDIVYENNGLYWNPARRETNQVLLEGVKEVLIYPIDGLIFDDYFYPGENVDKEEYQKFQETHPNITKEEFHREIVNDMVHKVHELCKKKNVLFGVSPEGNMENNYEKNGVDVETWIQEKYIDFIMPQLYYGFENERKPFVNVSNEWSKICKDLPIIPALAFYKVGKIDEYALTGKEEWVKKNDILKREIIHLRSLKNCKGYVFYRYDNIFTEEEFTNNSKEELESVKKIIK